MNLQEDYRTNAFKQIQDIVSCNIASTTIGQQLCDNKHITALYLAQLSYFTFDKIRKKTSEFGASRLSLYDHEGTQGFFAEFDNVAVVSFRGTQLDKWDDLKSSFTFWKKQFGDIRVHKGFARAIEKLIPNIIADVERVTDKRIIYVGHSLGGALATLLCLKHEPNELITFGAPKVAGPELIPYLDNIEYHRIVTQWDLVRWLPPNIPHILPYKHTGNRRVLDVKWYWNPRRFIHPHLLVTYLNALLNEDIT